MTTGTVQRSHSRTRIGPAGSIALALQGLTALGAVAGVQGFLSGAFAPLVDQLHEAWPLVDGPVLPAIALGGLVGLPHVAALVLGARRHALAPLAGAAVGAVLVVWVTAQLPLIGWTSPVQWAFVSVGLAELATCLVWRRQARSHAPTMSRSRSA